MEWHETAGWTSKDLPKGMRPLALRELPVQGDQVLEGSMWKDQSPVALRVFADRDALLQRTKRSLVFVYENQVWNWHRAGSTRPVDAAEKRVITLTGDVLGGYHIKPPLDSRIVPWTDTLCSVIGWRIAPNEISQKKDVLDTSNEIASKKDADISIDHVQSILDVGIFISSHIREACTELIALNKNNTIKSGGIIDTARSKIQWLSNRNNVIDNLIETGAVEIVSKM